MFIVNNILIIYTKIILIRKQAIIIKITYDIKFNSLRYQWLEEMCHWSYLSASIHSSLVCVGHDSYLSKRKDVFIQFIGALENWHEYVLSHVKLIHKHKSN